MSSLTSQSFIKRLIQEDYKFFTGVPCSLLSGLIYELEDQQEARYIPAVREDAAVGLCTGAYLAGAMPVLLMQNSGLGYSLNAFTSLNLIYNIPMLVIMSWRGKDGKDAPEWAMPLMMAGLKMAASDNPSLLGASCSCTLVLSFWFHSPAST